MDPVYIPRLLDEKDRILIFQLYEVLAFVFGFGLGIAFKMPMLGIGIGLGAFIFSRWLKRQGLVEVYANYLYWYIPVERMKTLRHPLEGTPSSALRVMTG